MAIYELMGEIEKLPASEQETNVVIMAGALQNRVAEMRAEASKQAKCLREQSSECFPEETGQKHFARLIMEGVADELKQAFGTNTIVDADQGRLPWNTPAIVKHLHLAGKIHATVILHIGNNGFLSAEVFNAIMAEFKDARQIVVVNLKVPRPWESFNNRMLAAAVKAYPNAVLVDWHGLMDARPKLFWKDGIHVRPEGARVYADLMTQAVHPRLAINPPQTTGLIRK